MPKRTRLQRPTISAPIGPVKSSRGPDLVRSNNFELVAGITQCTNSPNTPSDSVASRRSRRVSASFSNTEPPSASPTVVGSDVSAVTRIQSNNCSKGSLGKKIPWLSLSTRSLWKQPSKYMLVARPESAEDTENVPPPLDGSKDDKNTSAPRSMSKLPRSRTMMVLQDIKKSFSRPSLATIRNTNCDITPSPRNVQTFSKLDNSELSLSTQQSSKSTLASFPRIDQCPSPSPVLSIKHVGTAQSSEYWSGRFMALQDRFSSDNLRDVSSSSCSSSSSSMDDRWQTRLARPVGQSLTPSRNRLTYLAPSNTTSALSTITYNTRARPSENEDDLKCQRIFSHLGSLCTTPEAKQSLHAWQQAYARPHGRPKLLPEGGCMHDTSQKNRLLAGVGNRFKSGEKRRLSTLKDLADPRPGAIGITPGRGVAVY